MVRMLCGLTTDSKDLLREHCLLDEEVQIRRPGERGEYGVDGQAVPERLEWHFFRSGSPPTAAVPPSVCTPFQHYHPVY